MYAQALGDQVIDGFGVAESTRCVPHRLRMDSNLATAMILEAARDISCEIAEHHPSMTRAQLRLRREKIEAKKSAIHWAKMLPPKPRLPLEACCWAISRSLSYRAGCDIDIDPVIVGRALIERPISILKELDHLTYARVMATTGMGADKRPLENFPYDHSWDEMVVPLARQFCDGNQLELPL